jgi:hypothetical protein
MKKEGYERTDLEIIFFKTEDVITTSDPKDYELERDMG